MLKDAKIFKLFIAIYILLMPLLRYYQLPGGSNFYLLLVNIFAVIIILNKKRLRIAHKQLLMVISFFIWIILISVYAFYFSSYSYLVQSTSLHNFIVLCDGFIITIICFDDGMDYDLFISIYKYLCYFLLFYIALQLTGIRIPGFSMTGRIPFLPLSDVYAYRSTNFGVYPSGNFTRYSSCFIEPSHFAQYLTPLLCMSLYGYKDIVKKSIPFACIISLLMTLSISGTSIAIVIVVWVFYFFRESKNLTPSKVYLILVAVVVALILIWLGLQQAGILEMIQRMSNVNDNKVSDRVIRGFLVFLNLPILEKIFGIGYQCVYPASVEFGIEIGYKVTMNVREYVNDIASLILSFGIIGIIPISLLAYKAFKGAGKLEILIYIACLSIFVSESTFIVVWLMLMNMCIAGYKLRNYQVEIIE